MSMKSLNEILDEFLKKIKEEKEEKEENTSVSDYEVRSDLIEDAVEDAVVTTESAVILPKRTFDLILKYLDKEGEWDFDEFED